MLSRGREAPAIPDSAWLAARRRTPRRTQGRCPGSVRVRIPTAPPTRRGRAGERLHHSEKGGEVCSPTRQRSLGAIIGDSRTDRRLRRGAAGPESPTGLLEWPGLGQTRARGGRAPHRACAVPRAPGESRGRASSGPSGFSLPIRPRLPSRPAR